MPPGADDDDRPDQDRPRRPGGGRPRSDRARRADDRGGRDGGDRSVGRSGRTSSGRRGDRSPRSGGGQGGRPARGDDRRGQRSGGQRRDRSDDRRDRAGQRPVRGEDRPPRPPIKGRRRTFDVDSAPNERERRRVEGGEEPRAGERWVDEGPVRRAAGDAVQRGSRSRPPAEKDGSAKDRSARDAPAPSGSSRGTQRRAQRAAKRAEGVLEIDKERLRRRLGGARAERTIGRIGEAAAAYAEDRFEDARKGLKPIAELIPEEPAVRELHGLALYRLGRWRKAADELEEFHRLTGSTEQHPVLADCYRALGQHDRVEELWEEIGEESLAAPLVAEGRIVYAGSLADQGRLVDAIAVLEAGALGDKGLKEHHLRMRYVLGDLNDRAGERQAARRWFESVASASPGFFDVEERLRQL